MIDCVVVGAGPAGLAASAALAARGVAHVVLERGRVGQTWRTQRWDSFRLNTPGWMNPALGAQTPEAHATRAEVVARLETLATDRPVRQYSPVTRLTSTGDGYLLRTATGIWYVGLRWLVRRGSSILRGFPVDAATVADEVKAYLGGAHPAV